MHRALLIHDIVSLIVKKLLERPAKKNKKSDEENEGSGKDIESSPDGDKTSKERDDKTSEERDDKCDESDEELDEDDKREIRVCFAALGNLRAVWPFRDWAGEEVFRVCYVRNVEAVLRIVGSFGRPGVHVKTVHFEPKHPAMGPLEADPILVDQIIQSLPNVKKIDARHIRVTPPFRLPTRPAGDDPHSFALCVTPAPQTPLLDVISTDDVEARASVFAKNTRLAMPTDGTWSLNMKGEGIAEGLHFLYAQGIAGREMMNGWQEYVGMTAPRDAAIVIGLSSSYAVRGVHQLLQRIGPEVKCLQLQWTEAELQLLDDDIDKSLALGIVSCKTLFSLTMGLFVGSNAASSLEDQIRHLLILVRAASTETLQILSLIVNVYEDEYLEEYVEELGRLLRHEDFADLLHPTHFPVLREIRFNVLGAAVFTTFDIETIIFQTLASRICPPIAVRPHDVPQLLAFTS